MQIQLRAVAINSLLLSRFPRFYPDCSHCRSDEEIEIRGSERDERDASPSHRLSFLSRRLDARGWMLEAGCYRLDARGWRLEASASHRDGIRCFPSPHARDPTKTSRPDDARTLVEAFRLLPSRRSETERANSRRIATPHLSAFPGGGIPRIPLVEGTRRPVTTEEIDGGPREEQTKDVPRMWIPQGADGMHG